MKLPVQDVPIWVARLYLNLTLEEAGTLSRALLAMILSEKGGQGCTMPKEEEKLTCTSTKALANPVILSVNEDHASACLPLVSCFGLPAPGPIFPALLGGDKPSPFQRLCTEVKGCTAKNRCTGAERTFADILHTFVPVEGEGAERSGAPP